MKQKINIELPKFSWEKPIEEEILDYVRRMATQMERQQTRDNKVNFLFWEVDLDKDIKKGAECYAKAYRTVEKHILDEIKIRKSLINNK